MTDVPVSADNTLMITDVKTSKALRPQRLARRTDAFYAITAKSAAAQSLAQSAELQSQQRQSRAAAFKELLCLFEIWYNTDLKERMTESDYLEIREMIRQSAEINLE